MFPRVCFHGCVGPRVGPKCHIGAILGPCCGDFGAILGPTWGEGGSCSSFPPLSHSTHLGPKHAGDVPGVVSLQVLGQPSRPMSSQLLYATRLPKNALAGCVRSFLGVGLVLLLIVCGPDSLSRHVLVLHDLGSVLGMSLWILSRDVEACVQHWLWKRASCGVSSGASCRF